MDDGSQVVLGTGWHGMCVECDGELQTVITKGVGRYRVFDERAAEGRDEQADAYTGHLALGVHPGTVWGWHYW